MFTKTTSYTIFFFVCLFSFQTQATCLIPQFSCPDNFALIVPSQVTESDPPFQAIACTSVPYSQTIEIQLISFDRSEIKCPQSAEIPRYYTWIAVDMSVVDDFIVDGPIQLTLTAGFLGQTVTTQMTVMDNDQMANETLEQQALKDFFTITNGSDWKNNAQWLETDNPCTWHGIQCDNGVMPISEIQLNTHNLMGGLPSTLNDLADLKRLYLGHNSLSGGFSDQLYQTRLHVLWLQDNAFYGSLSDRLTQMIFLQDVNISNNQFSGNLPDNIGNLSRLEFLDLSSNQFTGPLPQSFDQFNRLTHLNLHDNQFTGSISVIAKLCQLKQLDIHNNQFTGKLHDLTNLPNIRTLDLGSNNFDNVFPWLLAQNTRILRIDVHDTHLSGQFPQWEAYDYALYALNLSANKLIGKIPGTIRRLTNLSSGNLDLRWNALYAETQDVKTFIDQKHIGQNWEITQTIAPENLTATVLSGDSVRFYWTPIETDTITGAYEIFYGYSPDNTFRKLAETTDKTESSYTLTHLNSSNTYYFKIRTRTDPHINNRNIVYSEFSSSISVTTQSIIETMAGANGQISPSGILSAPPDTPVVIHFIPDKNYHVENVLVDQISIGSVTSYTFSHLDYDHTIRAVFANDAPQIFPILPVTFDEDVPPAPIPLTIIDRETPTDNLLIRIVSDNPELVPQDHIQLSGSGSAKFLHLQNAPEMSGVGIIIIKVTDPLGLDTNRAFTYTVTTINDPPVASNRLYKVYEDQEIEGMFMALDIEQNSLTYYVTAAPRHGKLTHDAGKELFTYCADTNYSGRDYIRFKAQDNSKLGPKMSNEAVIVLEVMPVNDPPVSNAGEDIHVLEGNKTMLDGSRSYDVDDTVLTFEWRQSKGPEVALSSPNAISPLFIAPHAISDNQPISLVFWLKVYDDDNKYSEDNCIVWVDPRDPPIVPIAQMGMPLIPVSGRTPFRVYFEDQSIGKIDSWQWFFGDGHQSTRQSPVYTYDNPGIYTLKLEVSGTGGSDAITYTNWISVLDNPDAVTSIIPKEERAFLVDLFNQTQGTQWEWHINWLNQFRNEYYWYGVTVPKKNVIQLALPENALNGDLPDNLYQLTQLQSLDLSKNQITGPIPDNISQLDQLTYLDISENKMEDTVPDELSQLKRLTHMALGSNQFYGSIPQSIGEMLQLQYLNMGRNKLIGAVPVTFANLIHLTTMNISFNLLNGLLPDFIDQMTSLIHLDLSHNQFMGTIPDSFMRAAHLEEVCLAFNQLDGTIPEGFDAFENLKILDLSNNQFSGTIPKSLYETNQLTQLNLSNNLLEKQLMSRITLLKKLVVLDISSNQFNGILPVELTRLDQLQHLNLSHNLFSGTIPDISLLSLLRVLDISHNYFGDTFPESLFALKHIKAINISGNNFSGEIPEGIMQMDWLADNASDFRWNRLTVNNSKVEKFLAGKHISNESWINTQTIAPTGLKSVEGETLQDLVLSWTPIPYSSNVGGYEIYYAIHPDGPYERRYVTTSKLDNAYTFTNLAINETYYFKLRTVTYAHANNPNTLYSDYTPILPATIFQMTERPDNPDNLQAETYYKNRVMLSWKTIQKPENVYYRVFRSETIDGQYQCISLPLIIASFVDWNVREGHDYYYKIRSYLGETPSELFSNIVHAIPGTPTTYSINGHFTVALVSQGDTAIYSMTLEGASGFNGKIDMACLWPGSDPTTPPTGISPIFYVSGYFMNKELSRIPLPAPIQLKVAVEDDYTPSVLIFQLSVTDTQTQNQRLFYMQLHVIPKDECAIALSSDRPIYHEYAPIGISGFISTPMSKEPIDIQLKYREHIINQRRVKTLSDGYFETFFQPMPWISGSYTVQATWNIWDVDDIFCQQEQYGVSLPVIIEQSTCHIQLSMMPDQQVPKLNQSIDIMGEISTVIDNTTLNIRIISPDQTYEDRTVPLVNQQSFEIQDIKLSQPGIWQIKAYFPGNVLYPGSESNNLEVLVETPPGRAIIVGTRFPQYQRQLPQSTFDVCKHVYDHLIQRGFDPVEICALMHTLKNDPLTPDPPLEKMDWVDYINPTSQDFLDVLSNEFSDVLNPHMPLWIYIHGFSESNASFIMRNDYDQLSASQIDLSLDALQSLTQCPIIIILDMPYSGAFLPLLAGTNRVVLSSSENANYRVDPANDLSFSKDLFYHLQSGNNLFQAFDKSKRVWDPINMVSAQIDDNGDGIYSSTDGNLARQTFMNGPIFQIDRPVVSGINVMSQLQYATSLPISVSATAGTFPITHVKVKLFDPSPTPLFKDISTAIEDISYTLYSDDQSGMYHNVLTCLTEPGVYTFLVIARDSNLYHSDPVSVTVVAAPDTPVSYFDSVPNSTRHTLDALCGFFVSDDPDFHQVESPTDKSLRAIWGLNYRHVIAVGDSGTILFFDGNQWQFMESHTQQRLLSVWGTSSDNVYATGEAGVIQHFNGEMWETIETNIQNPLCGIWGTSPDNIYAVGGHGTILHYDGTSWHRNYTGWYDRLNCIWGRNASNIYAAGDNGLILHYDGSHWDAMPFCSTRPVDYVFGDNDRVFAIRFEDPIHFEAGQGWTPTQDCQYRAINAFWQSNLEYVFSAGESGQVFIWSSPPTCRDPNTPPMISPISDREIMVSQPVPPIPLTVQDNEHFPYELRLDVMSSNPALLPLNRIIIEGTGADRLILLEPIYGVTGTTYISVVVSDPCERKQAQGFLFKVTDKRLPDIQSDPIEMKDILDVLRKSTMNQK